MTKLTIACLLAAAIYAPAHAQTTNPAQPAQSARVQSAGGATARVLTQPGLKKLGVFIGTWKGESTVDATHKDKITAINTIQWSPNGKYLIADQVINRDGRETNNLSIYHYNPDKDDYTLSLVGIPGMQPFSTPVTYRGDTLFYNGEYTENGKKVYNRTLNIFTSPSSYIYKIQFSDDGVNWRTDGEGEAKKMR
ncbi:hypothetical protein [Puia dinghuensis]|nr:hypothetical protein [Puia dinghuensis]